MAVINMLNSTGISSDCRNAARNTHNTRISHPTIRDGKVYLFVPLKKTRSIYKTSFAAPNALKTDKYQITKIK